MQRQAQNSMTTLVVQIALLCVAVSILAGAAVLIIEFTNKLRMVGKSPAIYWQIKIADAIQQGAALLPSFLKLVSRNMSVHRRETTLLINFIKLCMFGTRLSAVAAWCC